MSALIRYVRSGWGRAVQGLPWPVKLGLGLAAGVLLFMFQARELQATASIGQFFSAAEQEPRKEIALRKWHDLLKDIAKTDPKRLPGYISADIVQRIIIDQQLQLYEMSGNEQEGVEAYNYIDQISDKEMRLWGLVYFLHKATSNGNLKNHSQLFSLAQNVVHTVYHDAGGLPADARERIYHGLALVLTSEAGRDTYPESEMRIIHELISHIKNSENRLDIMRRYGALGKSMSPTIYPVSMQQLYMAFAEGDPDVGTLEVIHREAVKNDYFYEALYALLGMPEEKTRVSRLKEYFQILLDQGALSRARRVAEWADNPYACVFMWSSLMREYLHYAYDLKASAAHAKATACANAMKDGAPKQEAFKLIQEREVGGKEKRGQYTAVDSKKKQALLARIDGMLSQNRIAEAAELVRKESDTRLRVSAFHSLAQRQARSLDRYSLLYSNASHKTPTDPVSYALPSASTATPPLTLADLDTQEETLMRRHAGNAKSVMVYEGVPSPIGQFIHYNALPEQTRVSGDSIRGKVPLPERARITLSHYESNIFNSTFTRLFANSGFVLSQKSAAPVVITVENGIADLPMIYDELRLGEHTRCIEKKDRIYTLRCPLIVGTNATLVMNGDDFAEMRLSTQSGSYILNANIAFLSDIKLTGWDDDNNRPMWIDYTQHNLFRPFFTSWNRSFTYIANSEITALGFDYGKSYGISFSSGPNAWQNLGDIEYNEKPTGIIVDNSFRNMMFGFYSYEAYNVMIVGNEYVDNIVYGIDPHDRSSHLVIAYNTVYGVGKKHGIILSREVGKSLIAGNLTFDNRGSGIMLDRKSDETLVYANTAFANDGSGLSLFESDCNIAASNAFFGNKSSGIRIRNSSDIGIYQNDLTANNHGITAYTLALEEYPEHRERNFQMDPYVDITAFAAVGNRITNNQTAVFIDDIDGVFLKQNDFRNQASTYRGDWFATRMADLAQMDQEVKGAAISRLCPTARTKPSAHTCMFRANGTLRGDGLDFFTDRISLPQCRQLTLNTETASKEATP